MSADFTPEKEDYKILPPFKMQVLTNFPYIEYDFDALTNYQLLCKVVEYLNGVIHNENEVTEQINSLYNAYIALQNYVNNYLDNIVPEEIDEKLDEYVEDGTLENLLNNKLSLIRIYPTTESMIEASSTLTNGMNITTLGYYNVNDGGGASFKISDTESANEFQIDLDGLYANLIVENDTISFKQIGCVADGTTNNATLINKALAVIKAKSIGNFYINEGTFAINDSQFIIPNGLHLYGNGKESIIQVNSLSNEVFMTNEHYLDYDHKDTFILENFRINKQAIGVGTAGKRCMRFACTDNVVIRNIYYYSNVDSQFGVLDIYSYNSNMLVENCKAYKINSTAGVLVGGYAIREFSSSHTTENITLRDCLIVKDGKDESLWIDAWNGIVKNVLVDNFKMIDNSGYDGGNSVFIGNERTGSLCENITIQNSYFYRKDLRYRILGIGTSELSGQTCYSKNINIINCKFECDTFVGESSRSNLVEIGGTYPTLTDEGCTIRNCIFKFNDTESTLGCFIHGINSAKAYSINNKFYGQVERGIWEIYESRDDYFHNAPTTTLYTLTPYIINAKCREKIPYLTIVQASTNLTEVLIENCTQLKCDRLLQNNSNTNGINYKIINCQIENDNETSMITNYAQTTNLMTLTILNTDIKTPKLTTSAVLNLKVSGLSVNGETFKGIPTHQNDRGNYPIGTVFLSNTATKSIVRKISDGNSTSNWEEV